ncbi:hypothetical protein AB0J42_32315 [Nonomuraea sp. NPDC049649]|uniref:hypothetical protein n=1 Tax=Nonomuraea sp. NPDC049649 TaxID=3155776 RepID=UPI0034497644
MAKVREDLSVADLDLHFQALEECASAARIAASKLYDLAGDYPAESVSSSIFGKLSDSSSLAGFVDDVEKLVDSELGHAHRKLKGVERALDKVEENVRTANNASGAAA